MTNTIYNKLVRDRIPEILKEQNKKFKVEQVCEQEVMKFLIDKFIEELEEAVKEMINCNQYGVRNELADLMSVIFRLADAYGISRENLLEAEEIKTESKGGFEENYILKFVVEDD